MSQPPKIDLFSAPILEDNVPVAPKHVAHRRARVHALRYPLKDMKPGQSFFVPTTPETHKQLMRAISADIRALRRHSLKHANWTFVLRTVEGGIRAWRTY